jgi:hypothetical protein
MSFPIYKIIKIQDSYFDHLQSIILQNTNQTQPIVFDALLLDIDQQREFVGLVENFYVTNEISFKFPYPIYIITLNENSISRISLIKSIKNLPVFFKDRELKLNVKESNALAKNNMLQIEIKNVDENTRESCLKTYSQFHKEVYELEIERKIYLDVLNRLKRKSRS